VKTGAEAGSDLRSKLIDVDPGDPQCPGDTTVFGGEDPEQHVPGRQAPVAALGRDPDGPLERELG
jgi:hypothetical protein